MRENWNFLTIFAHFGPKFVHFCPKFSSISSKFVHFGPKFAIHPLGLCVTGVVFAPNQPLDRDGKALQACIYKLPMLVFTGAMFIYCFVPWTCIQPQDGVSLQESKWALPTHVVYIHHAPIPSVFRTFWPFFVGIFNFFFQIHHQTTGRHWLGQKKCQKFAPKNVTFCDISLKWSKKFPFGQLFGQKWTNWA